MKNQVTLCTRRRRTRAAAAIALVLCGGLAGCAAFDPQGTAQQYAPSYYNAQYSSLTPEQKMQLEDHLSGQSNQAWRTTAAVASGLGRLVQGTGILLFAARH
jgi:hypothetical protein